MSCKDKDIRWKQRFSNFEKAKKKMHNAFDALSEDSDNELYQQALIQCFEFTYELGWKTIKDYLRYEGLKKVSLPREVIKNAFQHNIIENGQIWINMLEDRNLLSHTYDERNAAKAIRSISEDYIGAIDQVYSYLKKKL